MKYVHVVTVGASLVINYSGESVRDVGQKLGEMNTAQLKRHAVSLHEFLRKKGPEAAAEVSAMSDFLRAGEISLVYLLHTDTPVGRCCAEALGMFFEEEGIRCRLVEIKGYAGGPKTFQKGLLNLVTEISKILVKHVVKNERVRICATGGYKPESAIASILGFIAGASIYYIHTTFEEVVHFPSIPIDWRYEMRKWGEAIDELLVRESIPQDEFTQRFGREAAEDLIGMWLLERRDESYTLTETGKTLLEAVKLFEGLKR